MTNALPRSGNQRPNTPKRFIHRTSRTCHDKTEMDPREQHLCCPMLFRTSIRNPSHRGTYRSLSTEAPGAFFATSPVVVVVTAFLLLAAALVTGFSSPESSSRTPKKFLDCTWKEKVYECVCARDSAVMRETRRVVRVSASNAAAAGYLCATIPSIHPFVHLLTMMLMGLLSAVFID